MNAVAQTLPNYTIRRRRRLLICLALVATAAITCIALHRYSQSDDPFRAKFEQVRRGMTRQQVEEILGPPIEKPPYIPSSRAFDEWNDGNRGIVIQFDWDHKNDSSEEIVAEKWFMSKTRWDELQEEIAKFIKGLMK